MATLLITKETGGYFSFIVDGDVTTKVTNMRNDVLAIGTVCNFKTANGANIIKKQNIDVTAITLVASGTFTFVTVSSFLSKLIDVGYYDWLLGGGTGTGVDRFDELLDTFSYFGKDGQAVIVNESELKLETVVFHNVSKSTELTDMPSVIVPSKMVVSKADGTGYEFENKPTPPEQFLNAVGSFHYADLATQTTPQAIAANVDEKLLNDALGSYTNSTNAPYGISSVYNEVTNQLDFSQLSVGDLINFRIDLFIETSGIDQLFKFYIKFGIGSASEFTLNIAQGQVKTNSMFRVSEDVCFDIGSADIRDYPAEIWIATDKAADITINGWYIEIVRKNINIVDIGDDYVSKVGNDIITGEKTFLGSVLFNRDGSTFVLPDKAIGDYTIAVTSDITGGSETTTTMGALINSAGNATPNDTDFIATAESAGLLKKITLTNAKAFLKTYYDTIYTTTAAVASQITTALSGYLTSIAAASTYEPIKGSDDNYVTDAEKALIIAKFIYAVTETGTSFSLTDAHNGKITILTASCTVTIPNGLIAGFEHTIVTLAGVTLTVALGGSVVLFNNIGTTMAEKLSCTIKNRTTTNNYITAGSL